MAIIAASPDSRPIMPPQRFLMHEVPAEPFRKRLVQLKTARSYYDDEMKLISKFIRPRRSRWAANDPRGVDRRSTAILNTTATIASRTLMSGMQTGVSSPARPWFRLTTPDPEMAEQGEIKTYLTTVARRMSAVFNRSNIYNSLHTGYGDIGDFGTSVMMIDENFNSVIHTHVYSPGEYYLAVDDTGIVCTIYRELTLTVLAMVMKFGNRCSDHVMNLYNRGNLEENIHVVEAVEPNMQQVKDMIGPRGAPFIRVYFERDTRNDKLLDCKGLNEFPAACPRWMVRDGDVYGYGPGLEVLDDVMGLQVLEQRKQMMADKLASPPTQGGPTNIQIRNKAGQHTAVPGNDVSGNGLLKPLYEMSAQGMQALAAEIQRSEARIDEGYFKDLFLMFAQTNRREITAREVDERHEEKLLALGPVLERQHSENLDPAITRTFNIMNRAGILPEPPQALQGSEIRVQFVSMLAQAQRAVAIGGIENLARFVGGLSAAFPSVLDKLDADQAVDEYADATGVPTGIVNTDDQVSKIREDKAKQAQGEAAMQMAQQGIQGAKVLSETDITPTNMLGQISSAIGAGL